MNRLVQFVNVPECLQNEDVDAALDKRGNLLTENIPSFLKRHLAQRLNANPQWSYCAGDPCIKTLRCFFREACAVEIYVTDFVLQSMALKANRVSTERIGFYDLSSSLQIFMVNPANQVRLRNIQFVIAAVYEDALRIKQRAHGTIAEYRCNLQAG